MEKNLPLKIKKVLESNKNKLDNSGYIQFDKSIELKDVLISENIKQFNVRFIDGLQLLHESVKVWFSTENSTDIIYESLHLIENDDLLVLIENELIKQFNVVPL